MKTVLSLKTRLQCGLGLLLALVMLSTFMPFNAMADNYGGYIPDIALTEDYRFASITPTSSGFSATITGGGNTVAFGPGSRIEQPINAATQIPQTMRVYEEFPAGSPAPAVVIHLVHGMMLSTVVPGFTGTGNNRTFNAANLPTHLQGVVSHGRWIPSDPIVQNRSGNTLQGLSGTLIFLLAAGTTEAEIAPQVAAERIFSQTGSPGRLHSHAIRVETYTNIYTTASELQSQTFSELHAHLAGLTAQSEATWKSIF